MTREEWQSLRIKFDANESRWPTAAVIAFDCLAFAFSWKLSQGTWIFQLAAVGLLSLVLLHAYLWVHEATHSAISRKRSLNNAVGHLCGWMIGLPFLARQRSHLLHHAWAGHPEGDPANKRAIQRFSVISDEQAARLERIWKSWLPLLALNDRIGLWLDPFKKRRESEIRVVRWYWVGYGLAFLVLALTSGGFGFLGCYAVAWGVHLALEELANLPHHAETPLLAPDAKALPYWEQQQVTHSCRTLPIWSSFVLLNFNLHTAHHFYPWISWSGLPEVHRELLTRLPELKAEQQTRNELLWSMRNRKRPLLEIMGHYFDRTSRQAAVATRD